MSLTDALQCTGIILRDVAYIGAFVYGMSKGFDELIVKKYIPWANEFQKKCDKEEKEAGDDYNISSN